MMTPQEVSEHAFAKASFGGYNMAMVDEFLDVLTADYTTLYKENAVLKGKMKVLVDKVEEYRATEDAMRMTLLSAQKMANAMVAEAEAKKQEAIAQAEGEAQRRVAALQHEIESEELRLTAARNATTAYVAKLKELYLHEQEYIGRLSELTAPAPKRPDPVDSTVQDIEDSVQKLLEKEPADLEDTKELDGGDIAKAAAQAIQQQAQADKAKEKVFSLHEMEVVLPAEEEPTRRIDFDNLQFGKDYEIK